MAMLLTGCTSTANYETSRSICRELGRDLPTFSVADTYETLRSGVRFLDVYYAVCGGFVK